MQEKRTTKNKKFKKEVLVKREEEIKPHRGRQPQFTTMNVIDGQADLILYTSLIFYSLTIDNILNIVIMLILVGVTISLSLNGGLFGYAKQAVGDTKNARDQELELANGQTIDEIVNGTTKTGVKIELSISEGTRVENITVPTGFTHIEGTTIDTGYVIQDGEGNEFVWVPVNKDQKITLSVKTEKEIEEFKLYDPAGNIMLDSTKEPTEEGYVNIGKEYVNSNIEPTKNGMYIAVAKTTEGEITQKTLTVKSLYAMDTVNDYYVSDECAKTLGYNSLEEWAEAYLKDNGINSIEEGLQTLNVLTVEIGVTVVNREYYGKYSDTEDYRESVNKNGGFYIGRYEAGIGTTTARTSGNEETEVEEIIKVNGKPVSKEGAYPYNYVTYSQAKELAESMYEENSSFEVSLLTGSAWDRTLGWIYETKSKTYLEIYDDSGSWGNYYDSTFTFNGRYSSNYGSTWSEIVTNKDKPDTNSWLLTTGATERNRANNIYDIAGNVREWTNESYKSSGRVDRGGYCNAGGCDYPAAGRGVNSPDDSYYYLGFRPALYVTLDA